MMKGIISFIIIVCIGFQFVGCEQSTSTIEKGEFDENKAISMVIKRQPDFPSNQTDTLTKNLPTGGKVNSTTNVKFTTKAEKSSHSSYIITLIKDWGITVNGKYVKSSWKYKVTTESINSIEITDNDYLPNLIK